MKKQTKYCYKACSIFNGKLCSCFVYNTKVAKIYHLGMNYAKPVLLNKGLGLLAFEDVHAAKTFAINYGCNAKVFKCIGYGQMPLKENSVSIDTLIVYPSYFLNFIPYNEDIPHSYLLDGAWPRKTLMFKRLRLIEEI